MELIRYVTAREPVSDALFEYAMAGNGVFVRARRDICEVAIPVAAGEIAGLARLVAGICMRVPKVPAGFLARAFQRARAACIESGGACEYLCYLDWRGSSWEYVEPEQQATATSVRPVGSGLDAHRTASIEIHSHHEMAAGFSATDDEDESTGFRIYGVLGRIFSDPEASFRVGCHGHFMDICASSIFDMEARC